MKNENKHYSEFFGSLEVRDSGAGESEYLSEFIEAYGNMAANELEANK